MHFIFDGSNYQHTTEGKNHDCSVGFEENEPAVICEKYYGRGIDELLSDSMVWFINLNYWLKAC